MSRIRVQPLEVAIEVLENRESPDAVKHGLAVLRKCADVRDLARRALESDTDLRFGDLLHNFCSLLENGEDPQALLRHFPNWMVTLDADAIPSRPASRTTLGASVLGKMNGSMMLLEAIMENPELIDPELLNPPDEVEKLKEIAKASPYLGLDIWTFIAQVGAFYNYLKVIHQDYLQNPAQPTELKHHREKLSEFKKAAEEAMPGIDSVQPSI
ncbi:hypothetical protein HY463_01125 [Candidatus Peregrinibacteria bacterium]|nr:hypothetical protein [Candidatus Peregrinibacteria bacterium]